MKLLGQIIRRLREERGEPMRVIAAHLQVDQEVMSKIETGKRRASKDQVRQLAAYFRL